MRTESLIDSLIWFINVLLAFAIILFAFLFIIFPKRTSLADEWAPKLEADEEPEGPAPDERMSLEQFRSTWKTFTGPVVETGPRGPTVDLNKIYRVTACKVDPLHPSKRQVYLFNRVSNEEMILGEGEQLEGGFRIVEIGEKHIIAERATGGKPERQRLNSYVGEEPDPAGSRVPDETGSAPAGSDLPAILARGRQDPNDPNHWTVTEQERQFVYDHMEELQTEVVYRPYMPQGGEIRGLILEDFPADSIPARRGFQKNDVVVSVNGIRLNSTEAINSLAGQESLRNAGQVSVVVERQGRKITLNFDVQNR